MIIYINKSCKCKLVILYLKINSLLVHKLILITSRKHRRNIQIINNSITNRNRKRKPRRNNRIINNSLTYSSRQVINNNLSNSSRNKNNINNNNNSNNHNKVFSNNNTVIIILIALEATINLKIIGISKDQNKTSHLPNRKILRSLDSLASNITNLGQHSPHNSDLE